MKKVPCAADAQYGHVLISLRQEKEALIRLFRVLQLGEHSWEGSIWYAVDWHAQDYEVALGNCLEGAFDDLLSARNWVLRMSDEEVQEERVHGRELVAAIVLLRPQFPVGLPNRVHVRVVVKARLSQNLLGWLVFQSYWENGLFTVIFIELKFKK